MTLYSVVNPYPVILNQIGGGLNGGKVYVGVAGQDPQTNPVPVYWDEAGTIPASQPLDVIGGYIRRNGSPASVYGPSSYSIRVLDRLGALVFYQPEVNGFLSDLISSAGAGLVGFSQSATYPSGTVGATLQNEIFVNDAPFNANGDGVTNDTQAWRDAIAFIPAGGTIRAKAGTYMVDYLSGIDKQVHIVLDDGAVLKNRLPANPATTLDAHWGIFQFTANADGSSLTGGILDGNRATLAPYYNGHTRLGQDNHWWGARIEYAEDVTISGTRFINFMNEGFYAFNAPRFRALDFHVQDSGVAFTAQGNPLAADTANIIRGTAKNIGNIVGGVAYYIFQHGAIFAAQRGGSCDFYMEDYCGTKPGTDGVSTGGGKEPNPIAFSKYDVDDCEVHVDVRNYSAPAGLAGACRAFDFSSVDSCSGSLKCYAFEYGLLLASCAKNVFDVDFDGAFVNFSGARLWGIYATYGGVYPVEPTGLAAETTAALSSRDNVFRGTVTGFGVGVRDEGNRNNWGAINASGNVTDGLQFANAVGASNSYPISRTRKAGQRSAIGARANANGWSGLAYVGGAGDMVAHSDFGNNAQSFSPPAFPYNVAVIADPGEGWLSLSDNYVDADTQVIDTGGVTFEPGVATPAPANRFYDTTTTLSHLFTVTLKNTNLVAVGQWIRIPAALSGGLDAVGKVVAINADDVTLAHSSALVYSASSALTTLTGTGSTSGSTLTGVGTLFATEVDYKVYLKYGSEYRQIAYVNSNTSAILDAPFSSNMPAGTTLQIVKADLRNRERSASNSIYVNANVTTGPLLLRDNRANNLSAVINSASYPGITAGSRFQIDSTIAMAGTTLDNVLTPALPQYSQVVSVRTVFGTNITGTTGTNSIQIKQGGTLLATPITYAATVSGTIGIGPAPNVAAFTTTAGSVNFVSTVGNPTGTITARFTIEKFANS